MSDPVRLYYAGDIQRRTASEDPYMFTTVPALDGPRVERLLSHLEGVLPGVEFDSVNYSDVATGIHVSVPETGSQRLPLPSTVLSALGGGLGRVVFMPR